MKQTILIKNAKVLLLEENDVVVKSGEILIQNGKIAKIEEKIQCPQAYIIDAKDCIVMPGLINTHSHVAMSIFRETTEGYSLNKWLHEKIWPVEDKLTKQDIYYASLLSFVEMISTGTTCMNDLYFMPEQTRKAAKEAKIRAVLTRPLIDIGNNVLEQKIKEFKQFYETRDKEDDLITYTIAPHGLYTCSEECLEQAASLAKQYHLPVHLHFLESIDEIQDIQKLHGKTAIEVLKQHFEGYHTILAHGVKLSNHDIEVLKTMDCGISHNPISNLKLGCKIADTTKYLQNGINVALRNRWTRLRK